MLSFVLTFVWALLVLSTTTVVMSSLIRFYRKHFPLSQPTDFIGGVTLVAISVVALSGVAVSHQLLLPFTFSFLCSCVLLFCRLKVDNPFIRECFLCLICLLSVLHFPLPDVGYWVVPTYLICGFILYGIMNLFSIMDRVPYLSVLTLLTQGFFILLLTKMGILPTTLLMPLFYIFIAIIAITETTRIFTGFRILGSFASLIAGYMIGLIWIALVTQGFVWAPFIAFSYDLSEVIWAFGLYPLLHRGQISPTFFIEKAIEKNISPARLSRYLFFILLLLSLLAFMSLEKGMNYSVVVLLGFTLFGTYYQLNRWGTPRPSFRDLFSDLKQGMIDFKEEVTHIPLKKDKQIKKKSQPRKAKK